MQTLKGEGADNFLGRRRRPMLTEDEKKLEDFKGTFIAYCRSQLTYINLDNT